jgi:Bacterial PH domain
VSESPRERVGTNVRPRDYVRLVVIGLVCTISGVALCIAGWWALLGIPLAGLGALSLWVGSGRALRPDGVFVDDDGDTLVVRNILGRSRRLEWDSIVRFRTSDRAEGFVDLRDGSSVFLFSTRGRVDERREEIQQLIGRLNVMLKRRRGGRDAPAVDVRIGPVVSRAGAFDEMQFSARAEIVVGTIMLLAVLVAVPLDPSGASENLIGGILVGGFGAFYIRHGWVVMKKPDGVRIRENDDLIVVLDGWGHTRRIAWPQIASFRTTDDAGGVVDLVDGSRLWVFAPSEDGPGAYHRRDEIAEMIAQLNDIHERRRGLAG